MAKLLLALLLLFGALAFAEEPLSGALAAGAKNVQAGEAVTAPQSGEPAGAALPTAPSSVVLDDATTKQKYLDSMQRYYQYREDGYAFRSRVFEWQLFSSRMIFAIVVLLVLAGLGFAAIQFYVAMVTATHSRGRGAAATKGNPESPSPLATQLEISAKGIIVNSSVLGVVVLALSLAFFYLYLVYVYPIHEVL